MPARSFDNVDLSAVKFRLPTKKNAHQGWMATMTDSNGDKIFFKTPMMKIPFEPVFGGLTLFEDYNADEVDAESETPTEFSKFMKQVEDMCYNSFDQMRQEKLRQGITFGIEEQEPYSIVHKKSNQDEKGNVYTSMKYTVKIFKDNETGEYDTFEVYDEFNNKAKFQAQPGVRGTLLCQLHSWYYDGMRKKFHVRIYVRAIKLSESQGCSVSDVPDIRQWLDNPADIF